MIDMFFKEHQMYFLHTTYPLDSWCLSCSLNETASGSLMMLHSVMIFFIIDMINIFLNTTLHTQAHMWCYPPDGYIIELSKNFDFFQ